VNSHNQEFQTLMQTSNVSSENIAEFLTPQRILIPRIIQGALTLGVIGYGLILLVVSFAGRSSGQSSNVSPYDTLLVLSIANLALTVVSSVLAFLVHSRPPFYLWLSKSRRGPTFDSSGNRIVNPAAEINGIYITRLLVRLALLEGSAFFGLTVCFVGLLNAGVTIESEFWFNAIPAIIMLFYSLSTFPSKNRIIAEFQEIAHSI
jgi:hypothetical protein